jgi:hypothetical protein
MTASTVVRAREASKYSAGSHRRVTALCCYARIAPAAFAGGNLTATRRKRIEALGESQEFGIGNVSGGAARMRHRTMRRGPWYNVMQALPDA